MRVKISTLSGVALAAVAAAGFAAPAQAQDGSVTLTAAQWQAIQQELSQLHQDVDSLKASQQTTQAQATEAQTTATQAQATASKAQSAVADAVKSTKPSSASWADSTSISGRMYFNASAVSADNAAGTNVEKDGGFQIKRFYVSVDHKFNNTFSGDITVDVDNVLKSAGLSGGVLSTSNTGQGLYVKKAYLKASLNPAFNVALGATDMPWIPYVEGIYGYRHIEKTLTDLDGFGTSSDWGVHVMGSFAHGIVSYQVSAVDGGGYRNPQLTKTVDVEGRLSVAYKGFNAAIGGYTGKLGKDVQGATTFHSANRFNALLAYKGKAGGIDFTLGGEYFYAKNWNRVTSVSEDSSDGFSLFGSVAPAKEWSVFGRYDWVSPSKDLNPTQKAKYFNVGVQYSPTKIVDLALVYKRDDADNGLKIGNLGSGQATRDEIGLYGQFRW
jgi:hypothetical protein